MSLGVRLGVYTGFGLFQTVFVIIVTLVMAKGGKISRKKNGPANLSAFLVAKKILEI